MQGSELVTRDNAATLLPHVIGKLLIGNAGTNAMILLAGLVLSNYPCRLHKIVGLVQWTEPRLCEGTEHLFQNGNNLVDVCFSLGLPNSIT